MVEFVSANPTGPLHVGHGRQAALGDALARLIEWQGAAVTREFYYNDAGQQIENLAVSVRVRAQELLGEHATLPEDGYRGDYIRELAQRYLDEVGHDLGDIESIRRFAVAELRREQDRDLTAFGVRFDNYFLESSLYSDGRVDATVERLAASGQDVRGRRRAVAQDHRIRRRQGSRDEEVRRRVHVFRARRRVPRDEVGARLHDASINVQGSDHHSTVTRVRAGLQATGLGIPAGYPDYVLHKMVTVMKGGEEVKISKRAGSYVTLRELIDEVGRDAVRFFLVARKAESEFTFDIDLARSQTRDNPVYYVQYANARVESVMRQAGIAAADARGALARRRSRAAREPVRGCAACAAWRHFPAELALAARELAPHLVTAYLKELAAEFHSYYNAERFLVDDARHRSARGSRSRRRRDRSLRNGLAVLGISAPDQM